MHAFEHKETGVTIFTNGDNSGESIIFVPVEIPGNSNQINIIYLQRIHNGPGHNGFEIRGIPAAALAAFSRDESLAEAIRVLEQI